MPRNQNYTSEFLTEVNNFGIELEITSINRENPKFSREFNTLFPNFRRDHDASCESPSLSLNNIPVDFKLESDKDLLMPILRNNEVLLGGEIVSPVLSEQDKWKENIYELCDLLWKYGENSASGSIRDSLHIHVNVGKTIPHYKIINLLKLHSEFEAILYRLGGMGTVNRGEKTDYIFMRPFLGNSAPVVKVNKYNYPIFDYNDLLNSKDKKEFFDRFGDTTSHSARGNRYVTQRYVGLNFYAIPIYGTIEFRHSNKVLIPEWIIAWVNFCISFTKLCDNPKLEFNGDRPLYENRIIGDNEFVESLDIFDLTDETRFTLLDIWQKSPTPTFDNKWRYSHLPDKTFFEDTPYKPKYIKDEVFPPNNIHYRDLRERLQEDIRNRDRNNPFQIRMERNRANNNNNPLFINRINHREIVETLEIVIRRNMDDYLLTFEENTIISGISYRDLTVGIVYQRFPVMSFNVVLNGDSPPYSFTQPVRLSNGRIYFPRVKETLDRINDNPNDYFELDRPEEVDEAFDPEIEDEEED